MIWPITASGVVKEPFPRSTARVEKSRTDAEPGSYTMRIIGSLALGIIALASATPVLAQARNCTAAERAAANAQLLAIQNDAARRQSILDRHLPLGAPVSTHVVQNGPDNEDLLAQEGYQPVVKVGVTTDRHNRSVVLH